MKLGSGTAWRSYPRTRTRTGFSSTAVFQGAVWLLLLTSTGEIKPSGVIELNAQHAGLQVVLAMRPTCKTPDCPPANFILYTLYNRRLQAAAHPDTQKQSLPWTILLITLYYNTTESTSLPWTILLYYTILHYTTLYYTILQEEHLLSMDDECGQLELLQRLE